MKSRFILTEAETPFLFSMSIIGLTLLATLFLHPPEAAAVIADPPEVPIYSVETGEKVCALTINCAWDDADLAEILDLLDEENIRATFFLLGEWCEKYPDDVREIFNRGHDLGTHSYSHRDHSKLSARELEEEVTKAADAVESLTGVHPRLIRPPSGDYSSESVRTILRLGYLPIQWDTDSLDYRGLTPDEMASRVLHRVRCGSITLFHLGGKHTPDGLRKTIAALRNDGYSFSSVSDLILTEDYYIDHEGRQHPTSHTEK